MIRNGRSDLPVMGVDIEWITCRMPVKPRRVFIVGGNPQRSEYKNVSGQVRSVEIGR